MAELGSTNIHGDLNTTGDHNTGGVLSEGNQRVFSPNNRNISSSVASASSTVYASSAAAKAAYDRATQAINLANGKLAAGAKAVDSDKVDGYHASTAAGAPNTVVVRNSSGYIANNWFNSNRANESSAAASYIYDTGDGYMRKKTTANARNELVTASDILAKLRGVDGAGSGLDADLLDGKHGASTATANTIALRDSSGDVHARLFRTSYQNEARVTGAMAFRVSTSDNYIRFCSNPAAIRDWLGVAAPTAWTLLRSGSQAGNYISPVSLAGKEVCFVSTDRGGTNETAVTKVFIPAMSGFSNDTNCYIPNGHKTIEYDYYTREIRTYGDFGNRQIWYRTPPVNEYPAIGTLRP